ncbi:MULTISPECIES: response regulator [Pseudolactococcus]|uniref:Transcriptional regulatory protein n=1 Tax=Pseudolactococcus piscium MKFS47 TaxID=297352 RepID=A0A0D6DWK5_9LACT|nr:MULTISPECIES: response regulator [Lactococcus]MCJ1972026.1 response regulator [Lactococcus carnosus]MCJ2000648.1 response regulator [Lactococcus carnosus]CEN28365.1 Transcriptional regulatory protein MaeR [Lactococcus piscium MKFS47]
MHVLIVEDDPMVEFIHRNYLEKSNKFSAIYSANSLQAAQEILDSKSVDLLLLDIHLKDGNGLDLLSHIRKLTQSLEVIVITAASEAKTVEKGLHFGVVDYLIKPFTNERFQESLSLFFQRKQTLAQTSLMQAAIDQLVKGDSKSSKMQPAKTESLDKGLVMDTLSRIKETINRLPQPFTIQELAEKSGFSHVSVRKYIVYLEEQHELTSQVIYTKIGRPYKIYTALIQPGKHRS